MLWYGNLRNIKLLGEEELIKTHQPSLQSECKNRIRNLDGIDVFLTLFSFIFNDAIAFFLYYSSKQIESSIFADFPKTEKDIFLLSYTYMYIFVLSCNNENNSSKLMALFCNFRGIYRAFETS